MAELHVVPSTAAMGAAAASACISALNAALETAPTASLMIATGNSQFSFYEALAARATAVDWSRVVVFHLDEYVGLPATHSASFQRYLNERFVSVLRPGVFHAIDGTADPAAEVARYAALLAAHPRDVCCFGVGENGHLAFNVRAAAPRCRRRRRRRPLTPAPPARRRTRPPWAARTSRTPRW